MFHLEFSGMVCILFNFQCSAYLSQWQLIYYTVLWAACQVLFKTFSKFLFSSEALLSNDSSLSISHWVSFVKHFLKLFLFKLLSHQTAHKFYHRSLCLSSTFFKKFWSFFSIPFKRRRRDLNPRAAINDLLPFQGSPFSRLGTSPSVWSSFDYDMQFPASGEDGIRTHAPLRTNGFQDRLVMTTSIPLHVVLDYDTIFYILCQ